MFTAVKCKQPKYPLTDEQTKKMWGIYTIGYSSVIKDNETSPRATTQMNSEGVTLSEISHMEKDKYHMMSPIWWNLKANKTKQSKTKINL